MSRLIRVSSSEGEESYRYDALGRMTEKTDREGMQTQYAYTPDGTPQGILYGDGRKVELSYTHLRELSMVKDWLGGGDCPKTNT